MTADRLCADCGEPGFVAAPATPDRPQLVLCENCFVAGWERGYAKAAEQDLDAAYQRTSEESSP